MGRSISFRRSKTDDATADRKVAVRNLLEKTTLEALRNQEYKDVNGNVISKSSHSLFYLRYSSNKSQPNPTLPILPVQDGNVLWIQSAHLKRPLMEDISADP